MVYSLLYQDIGKKHFDFNTVPYKLCLIAISLALLRFLSHALSLTLSLSPLSLFFSIPVWPINKIIYFRRNTMHSDVGHTIIHQICVFMYFIILILWKYVAHIISYY